eukprot:1049243-Amphidinium_carterae.1
MEQDNKGERLSRLFHELFMLSPSAHHGALLVLVKLLPTGETKDQLAPPQPDPTASTDSRNLGRTSSGIALAY